jgi:hypothetical protein
MRDSSLLPGSIFAADGDGSEGPAGGGPAAAESGEVAQHGTGAGLSGLVEHPLLRPLVPRFRHRRSAESCSLNDAEPLAILRGRR